MGFKICKCLSGYEEMIRESGNGDQRKRKSLHCSPVRPLPVLINQEDGWRPTDKPTDSLEQEQMVTTKRANLVNGEQSSSSSSMPSSLYETAQNILLASVPSDEHNGKRLAVLVLFIAFLVVAMIIVTILVRYVLLVETHRRKKN